MNRRNDPFFSVPLVTRPTSEGDVEFPIRYYDTSCMQAFFLAERDRVEKALAGTPYAPGLVLGNKALVGFAFFEYRDTSVGPYNEVGIAIPVVPAGTAASVLTWRELLVDVENPARRLGFHILHLPVTTAAAWAAGREIWGYPKFVTNIPVSFGPHRMYGQVDDPDTGKPILTLDGKPGLGFPSPALSLLLYSKLGETWLRTTVNVRGAVRGYLPGSMRLAAGPSRHPMADTVRALGLDGAKPIFVTHTDAFQSRLNLGVPV